MENTETGTIARTIVIKDGNPVVGSDPAGCTGDITSSGGMTCSVAAGATLTFNVHHTVTATCEGGSASNSATASWIDDAGAPHTIDATNATNISVTIPADTSLCTHHVTIKKVVDGNPNDSTEFTVNDNGSLLGGSISGDGVHIIQYNASDNVTHTYTENPVTGYVEDANDPVIKIGD